MTNERLTAILAERVMRWSVGPDRLMTGNRSWISRWRFQPTVKLADALHLLEVAAPEEYTVCVGTTMAIARSMFGLVALRARRAVRSKPCAITWAIARAVGIEVEP